MKDSNVHTLLGCQLWPNWLILKGRCHMSKIHQTKPIVKLMWHISKLQVNMQSGELAMVGTITTYIS